MRFRAGRRSREIQMELDGDSDWLESHPMLRNVRRQGQRWQVETGGRGRQTRPLLREVVSRVRVLNFEVKAPSLHEILSKQVGGL